MEEAGRIMKNLILPLLFAGSLLATAAEAATPKNALGAIAVSPNGETVLAAGDNRVLYVLDAGDLTVRDSIWIGINPLSIFYSRDGGTIVIHDTKNDLRFYDTQSWEETATVGDANAVALAENADIVFAAGRAKGRGDKATTALYGYDMTTGKAVLNVTAKGQITAIGAAPDGSRIFGLTKAADTDSEKKQKAPSNLKGVDKLRFQQENDAKNAQFITFDANGKELGRTATWFSSTSALDLIGLGDATLAVGYRNINGDLNQDGTSVEIFQTKNSFNYGIGYSVANDRLVTGGLANGTMTRLSDRSMTKFSIDKIGGWPEYFEGFAIAGDGTAYGGTTAYRLVKISPEGNVEMVVPVY